MGEEIKLRRNMQRMDSGWYMRMLSVKLITNRGEKKGVRTLTNETYWKISTNNITCVKFYLILFSHFVYC